MRTVIFETCNLWKNKDSLDRDFWTFGCSTYEIDSDYWGDFTHTIVNIKGSDRPCIIEDTWTREKRVFDSLLDALNSIYFGDRDGHEWECRIFEDDSGNLLIQLYQYSTRKVVKDLKIIYADGKAIYLTSQLRIRYDNGSPTQWNIV